jgi:hypothetical protein
MEIRVFGMTLRLEVIIITLLVGMIMGGHLLCACAKVPISEAFSEMVEGAEGQASATTAAAPGAVPVPSPGNVDTNSTEHSPDAANNAEPIPAEPKDAITTSGGATKKKTEGFGDFSEYKKGENNTDVTGSWMSKATKYSSDLGYQPTNCKSNAYVGTAVPLPDGELFFFQNNQFKPECCPGPYSSSTGCACMSSEQIRYLNTRGGNRTSDSEF